MKECPECRLVNPDAAQRCDCGYDFDRKILYPIPQYRQYLKSSESSRRETRFHLVEHILHLILKLLTRP